MCFSYRACTCLVSVLQVNACIKFCGQDSATDRAHIGTDSPSNWMPCAMSRNLMHAKLYERASCVVTHFPSSLVDVLAGICLAFFKIMTWNVSMEVQIVSVVCGSG
jgi:hypothetical protein